MFVLGFVIHTKAIFSNIESTCCVDILENSFKTKKSVKCLARAKWLISGMLLSPVGWACPGKEMRTCLPTAVIS